MLGPPVSASSAVLSGLRYEPVGERCVLIRVAEEVDIGISRTVHAITAWIQAHGLPGLLDVVPAFNTVAVYFRPSVYSWPAGLPTQQVTQRLQTLLTQEELVLTADESRVVDIPVCYGGEFGPDLHDVAERCKLLQQDVIELHTQSLHTVYAFFFSPGNSFSGPLDRRLNVGRRATPAIRVEAGSVAIANGITSIYDSASPGGWNVIGRTPCRFFDIERHPPVELRLGDRLRFTPVSSDEFRLLEAAR